MPHYSAIKGKGLAFLLLLWSLWFIIMLARTTIGPILPLIEDEFLVRHAKATSLVSLFALGGALSTFAAGVIASKIGYKKSVLLCLAGLVAIFLLIPHVKTFFELAVLLFVFGVVWGTYFPCVIPIVTGHFAPSIWGRSLAIQDTGASLSVLAAPLLATLMLRFISWRQFFYVYAAAYVVLGVLFQFSVKEVKGQKGTKINFGDLLKQPSLWVLGMLWALATGSFLGVYQVTPLYFTKELSFSTQYANTIFGLPDWHIYHAHRSRQRHYRADRLISARDCSHGLLLHRSHGNIPDVQTGRKEHSCGSGGDHGRYSRLGPAPVSLWPGR
jgi:predicted MFS family arabinose efflux permease